MLYNIYIATTVFGVISIFVDFIGIAFGGNEDGSNDDDGEGDSGDYSNDDISGVSHNGHSYEGHEHGVLLAHDQKQKKNIVLTMISALRSLLHFCLGFGPVGWYALATGETTSSALIWSISIGVITVIGAKLIRRIQRTELNSQIKEQDLLFLEGQVLVSILPNKMGKVRLKYEEIYVERYAKAKDKLATFKSNRKVKIVDVTPEYLIVTSNE